MQSTNSSVGKYNQFGGKMVLAIAQMLLKKELFQRTEVESLQYCQGGFIFLPMKFTLLPINE